MQMINFLKNIFTWWHQKTIGTFIYTLINGKYVGKDSFGNKYYQSSTNRRWVIYKDEINASKIPNEWYSWMHFLKNEIPSKDVKKYNWQLNHTENLTGTKLAYKPSGTIFSKNNNQKKKYDTWLK